MLVIFEPVLDGEPGHPDVNAWLRRVAFRILVQDRSVLQDRRVQ